MTFFSSSFSLMYKDYKMDNHYCIMANKQIIKYNLFNVIFTLIFVLFINIIILVSHNTIHVLKIPHYVCFYCSLILLAASFISFIIILIKRNNLKIQKIIAYQMSITLYVVFSFFRFYIFDVFQLNIAIGYFISTFEYVVRVGYVCLNILTFQETAICGLIQIGFYLGYWTPLITWWKYFYLNFIYYFIYLSITIVIIYFYCREIKTSFALRYQIQNTFEWYETTMNCSNTGLMRIENNKILFMNDMLLEYLKTNKTLFRFIYSSSLINKIDLSKESILSLLNNRLEVFLNLLLLSNSIEDTNINEDIMSPNTIEHVETERELSNGSYKKLILFEALKRKYKKGNSQDMKFVSFGCIKLSNQITRDDNNTITEENSSVNENNDNNQRKPLSSDWITLEVLFRYYHEEETDQNGKDKFDFVFNNVTEASKKAEFKYKALYLSKVAHEFKNPLITIIELAENIKETKVSDEKSNKKTLNFIQAYSNYMLFLSKDMETFTHTQLHHVKSISLSKINIDEMVCFLSQVANCLIKRYNKTQTVRFVSSVHVLMSSVQFISDEIKLKQILINLISNAIKFTNEGQIMLKIVPEERQKILSIIISDTGVGMNEDIIKNIFSPFFKTNRNNSLGMGLGMNIVKELCKVLKSKIQFESVENVGSKFWVTLPLSHKHNYSDLNENILGTNKPINMYHNHHSLKCLSFSINQKNCLNNFNNSFESNESLALTEKIESFQPYIAPNSLIKEDLLLKTSKLYYFSNFIIIETNVHHIIIADDEPLIRKATIRVLKNVSKRQCIPIEIHEANDGYEVLYLLTIRNSKYQKYDLIVCDENMVYFGGEECQKEISMMIKQDKLYPIPFFILSANFINTSYNNFHISKPLTNDIAERLLLNLGS